MLVTKWPDSYWEMDQMVTNRPDVFGSAHDLYYWFDTHPIK
ncbi:hypothetical protein [Streptomyces sp. Ag109_G2-15]|nr:hypothetical protein [Streptomyces sp. Ag109_G2-15]SOD90605.1 hypothetical protein SAMN06272765_6536 [Streptomyces sp. Ag109_G2-15]